MYGNTRQAFYKQKHTSVKKWIFEQQVIAEVKKIRQTQAFVGGRKLQRMLMKKGIKIGRDKLFNILRNYNMLVKPMKKYTKTTNSFHRFRKYPNLIKDLEIEAPNQVFVSDITYIDTLEGFCYLSLITDVYSRKIVGYDLSMSLSIEGCQRTLRMALEGVSEPEKLIHHSDCGIQYCSNGYVKILEYNQVNISMTEQNHIYENALAERVNGILKTEFMLGEKLRSLKVAKELVKESIRIYNEERLHMSIDYQIPAMRYAA